MGLTGAKSAADLHNAGGGMLGKKGVLTVMAVRELRIQVFQFLRCDKSNIGIDLCTQLGIPDL